MAISNDIAVVGWSQTPMVRHTDKSEVQLLMSVITDALEPLSLTRADIDFTCLGSCDYITGQAFSFVGNLDAIGAWPPKRDSHVEMDGAWALYEAWLRLQEGDIDIAVVTGSGRSSTGDPSLIYPMEMDPYFLAPLGADPLTFAGLAGLGDLVATCSSPLSRNRTFGEHLGRGESLEEAQRAARQTAEGVKSCLAIRDLARAHHVEMPITEQVERVCHEGVDPRVAVKLLMGREMKPE